jgi:hypothetical protein
MQKVVLTVLKGKNALASLGLFHAQSLFGREPSCMLILQGYGVGMISHRYMQSANCLHEVSTMSQSQHGRIF